MKNNKLTDIKVNHHLKEETLKACREGKQKKKLKLNYRRVSIALIGFVFIMSIAYKATFLNETNIETAKEEGVPSEASNLNEESYRIQPRGEVEGHNEKSISYSEAWGQVHINLGDIYNEGNYIIQPITVEYSGVDISKVKLKADIGTINEVGNKVIVEENGQKIIVKAFQWKYKKMVPKVNLDVKIYEFNKIKPIENCKVVFEEKDGVFSLIKNQ